MGCDVNISCVAARSGQDGLFAHRAGRRLYARDFCIGRVLGFRK